MKISNHSPNVNEEPINEKQMRRPRFPRKQSRTTSAWAEKRGGKAKRGSSLAKNALKDKRAEKVLEHEKTATLTDCGRVFVSSWF